MCGERSKEEPGAKGPALLKLAQAGLEGSLRKQAPIVPCSSTKPALSRGAFLPHRVN